MPAVIKDGSVIDISNYVKADDLKGRDVLIAIEKVQSEKLSLPGKKPSDCAVAYFVGASKPLILNTTNLRTLRNKFGKVVADWQGKKVTLYPTTTKLRGNTVPCIRIREESAPAPVAKKATGDVFGQGELTDEDKAAFAAQEAVDNMKE